MMLGNVRSDEGDSNQNVKKVIGMIKKTTNLPIHSHFLGYISLPSLYDFDEKMPNFSFYWGCKQLSANFLCLSELGCGSKEFNSRRV